MTSKALTSADFRRAGWNSFFLSPLLSSPLLFLTFLSSLDLLSHSLTLILILSLASGQGGDRRAGIPPKVRVLSPPPLSLLSLFLSFLSSLDLLSLSLTLSFILILNLASGQGGDARAGMEVGSLLSLSSCCAFASLY